MIDGQGNADESIELAIHGVVQLLRRRFRTLLACSAGMSRAPVIASAVLATLTADSLDRRLATIVAESPHDVSPTFLASVERVFAASAGRQR